MVDRYGVARLPSGDHADHLDDMSVGVSVLHTFQQRAVKSCVTIRIVIDDSTMTGEAAVRAKLEQVYVWLVREYGTPLNERRLEPLDELIGAILSQHTSGINSRRAFESLKSTFPSWEDVSKASEEEIADAIRRGGLADQKAPRIKNILTEVLGDSREENLSWLASVELDEARDYLTSLPGVGPKTAACVLLFSLGRRAFPVDTHVQRLARRLALVADSSSPTRTQQYLESVVPKERMYPFHINLIRHGRTVCRARRPSCERCGLRSVCAHYANEIAAAEGMLA